MRKAKRGGDGCLRLFEELIAGANRVSRKKQLIDRDAQSPETDPSRDMKSTMKVHGTKEVQLRKSKEGASEHAPAGERQMEASKTSQIQLDAAFENCKA